MNQRHAHIEITGFVMCTFARPETLQSRTAHCDVIETPPLRENIEMECYT